MRIRCIITTPHYPRRYEAGGLEKKEEPHWHPRSRWRKRFPPDLHIISGAEIYYSQEAVEDPMMGDVWTLNASKYVLIEFATYVEFTYIRQAVQTLQYNGYLPILAHIERYDALLIERKCGRAGQDGCLYSGERRERDRKRRTGYQEIPAAAAEETVHPFHRNGCARQRTQAAIDEEVRGIY